MELPWVKKGEIPYIAGFPWGQIYFIAIFRELDTAT